MKEEYNPEFNFAVEFKLKSQTDRSYLPTEDVKIKELTSQYGALFYPSYPDAQTSELLLLYTLSVEDSMGINKDIIIKAFLTTGKFENDVKEFECPCTTACVNPVFVNDRLFQSSDGWPLHMIEAPCAWSFTRGNPNVLIGIVDTEFRTTHQDLENKFASISGASSANNHHGTMVASVAAANTNNELGMASIGFNSRIAAHRIPHRVNLDGTVSPLNSAAIRDAIWNLFRAGVRIINASWDRTHLDPAAAREITHSGIGAVLVLSAGNDNLEEYHRNIADIPGVIVVSSVDMRNMHGDTGHARNRWIDICAPGVHIMVATGVSNNSYGTGMDRGTSLAAPFVAGTVALMRSVNPTLTATRIEQLLKQTADPIADGHLFPGLLGAGRLNAFRAVVASLRILGPDVVPCSGTVTYTLSGDCVGNWSVQSGLTIIGASQDVRSITVSRNPAFAPDSAFVSVTIPGIPAPIRKRLYIGVEAVTRIEGPTHLNIWSMGWYDAVPHHLSLGGNYVWSVSPSPSQMHTSMNTALIEFGREGSFTVMCRARSACTQQFDPATLYVHVSHFLASSVQHNLASGTLHIEINPVTKEESQEVSDFTYDIHLYDDKVNMMKQKITKENKTTFDVADLPGGNYFLHIHDGVNGHPIVQLITIEEKS